MPITKIYKRLKHKGLWENFPILCAECKAADVTADDGEMECICSACWKIIYAAQDLAYKLSKVPRRRRKWLKNHPAKIK